MILTATAQGRYRIAPGDLLDGRRYGLLAPFRGHGGKRPPPIVTAREDDVAKVPTLRKATRVSLGDGFYATAKINGTLHAWWCSGDTVAALATVNPDDGIPSFCVLLAASTLPHIPLAPPGAWRAVEVSRRFEKHDDAAAIAPLGNPNQGSLF